LDFPTSHFGFAIQKIPLKSNQSASEKLPAILDSVVAVRPTVAGTFYKYPTRFKKPANLASAHFSG